MNDPFSLTTIAAFLASTALALTILLNA